MYSLTVIERVRGFQVKKNKKEKSNEFNKVVYKKKDAEITRVSRARGE